MEWPKLKLKIVDSGVVLGGKVLGLCWPDGSLVGGQTEVVLKNGVGEIPTAVISFNVDGDSISLDSGFEEK